MTVGTALTVSAHLPKAMFEAVFTLSLAPVLVLDDESRFRAVSRAASQILGYDRSALVGRRLDEFLPGDSGELFRSVWPAAARALGTRLHEIELIRADGSLIRVSASATPNVVPGLHVLTFDVNPEHQLAERDPDQFFASSPALLAMSGTDGFFTRVNAACERAFGATEGELGTQSYMERTHPADRQALDAVLSRLRDGEESCTVTLRMRSGYGIYRAIAWEMSRVPGQDVLAAAGRMLPISELDDELAGPDVVAALEPRGADIDVVVPMALEWLAVSAHSGIEPNLALEIERQMMILDDVTRRTPEPRAAAIRCALALRQSLAEMGTIVQDLQHRPAHVVPANLGGRAQGHSGPALSDGPDALTLRQREVLRLVARGEDNRSISRELFLAEVTVKKHVHQIMLKLGVVNRTQAAIMAYRLGLDVA